MQGRMLGAGKQSLKAAISHSRNKAGVQPAYLTFLGHCEGRQDQTPLWLPPGAIKWEAAGT